MPNLNVPLRLAIFLSSILCPIDVFCADTPIYIAAVCRNGNSGAIQSYCNGTYKCALTSGREPLHSTYKYCTPVDVGEIDSIDGHDIYLLCFNTLSLCENIQGGCASTYKATKPTGNIINGSIQVGSIGTLSNYNQLECCAGNGTYGTECQGTLINTTAYSTAVVQVGPAWCRTNGTCAIETGKVTYKCNAGYYSTKNMSEYSGNENPRDIASIMGCTQCPAGTFGKDVGLTSSTCNGKCESGTYSTSGATSCSTCNPPPNNAQFTNSTGNTSPDCPFQCKIGYYGTTSCSQCPSPDNGGTATTGTAGATSIQSCYVAGVSTGWSDTYGQYKCNTNAYHE